MVQIIYLASNCMLCVSINCAFHVGKISHPQPEFFLDPNNLSLLMI